MRTLIAFVVICIISFTCEADEYITATLFSKHFEDKTNEGVEHNEENYGLGFKSDSLVIGFFENSHEKTSIYFGKEFEHKYTRVISFGIQAGFVSGYTDDQLETPAIGNFHLYALPEIILTDDVVGKAVRYKIGIAPGKKGAITLQIDMEL